MFSVSGGGIICPDCAEAEKREPGSLICRPEFDIIDVFRYFESKPIKTFEKVGLKPEVRREVREILADYTDRYLGVDVLRGIEEPEVK
jgi:recombinational DNA repair protein (RecF pathway)